MNIIKSVRISKKGQFVIPKEMREALGVKEGEELLVTLEAGKVYEYAIDIRETSNAAIPRIYLRYCSNKCNLHILHY